jgi:hypothetical protein
MPGNNVVDNQLDYLADRLTNLEGLMIDPISFGEIKAKVDDLARRMDSLEDAQGRMTVKLDKVLEQLSEAKGSWHALVVLSSGALALGGFLGWVAEHLLRKGP